MEKRIVTISYWLGLLCVVLALLFRFFNIVGASFAEVVTKGNPVGFRSFLNGAELFYLTCIGTAAYLWSKSRQP